MYRIKIRTTFEAAHKLSTSYSQACKDSIHGHSYKVDWYSREEDSLDENGVVVDFTKLKQICRKITEEFDHSLILPKECLNTMKFENTQKVHYGDKNPTAENMAYYFWKRIFDSDERIFVRKVRVWEKEDCYAEYVE
jgi:6-pyruvoyltetrahydropterin/6-carboxytetrahydropterin synthase